MIDYIMSKMTWIIIAVLLTASVIGVYRWQASSTEELHLGKMADMVTDTINRALSTHGDFVLNITYENTGEPYMVLPGSIQGEPYSMNITSGTLSMHRGNQVVQRKFLGHLRILDPHFLDLDDAPFPVTRDTYRLHLPPGTPFVIESKTIGGIRNIYIYPDDHGVTRARTTQIRDSMEDFIDWTWDGNVSSVDHFQNDTYFDFNVTFLRNHVYPSHHVPVPFTTPMLNFSISGTEHGDLLEVPGHTEITFNRTLVVNDQRVAIEYWVDIPSTAG